MNNDTAVRHQLFLGSWDSEHMGKVEALNSHAFLKFCGERHVERSNHSVKNPTELKTRSATFPSTSASPLRGS